MQVIHNVQEMQAAAEQLRLSGKRIGLVPTMGFLHEGHASLIRLARKRCDVVVTTVFVNPTQFGPQEDLKQYPRDIGRDRQIAAESGTDIFFSPEEREVYPEPYLTYVVTDEISSMLEGAFRPTHFRGVTTIVCKLFNMTKPNLAVFGQKDAQQAFIIQKMVRDLNFDIEILVAPIVREKDGLALSSRNTYLSQDERRRATALYRALQIASEMVQKGERSAIPVRLQIEEILQEAHVTATDYIAFVRPETFKEIENFTPPSVLVALAVRFGGTRLIDNMRIDVSRRR